MLTFIDDFPQSLQLLSFPAECLGLLLVCIEIFRPERADAIERWINALPLRMQRIDQMIHHKHTAPALFGAMFTGVLGVFYALTSDTLLLGTLQDFLAHRGASVEMLGFVLFALVLTLPVCILLGTAGLTSGAIAFLNRVSGGRALGTIGLLFGVVGATGETFQMFVGTSQVYWSVGLVMLAVTARGMYVGVVRPHASDPDRDSDAPSGSSQAASGSTDAPFDWSKPLASER
mgnify:CR=1 FL=1